MEKYLRNAIGIAAQNLRKTLEDEYFEQLEGVFDVHRTARSRKLRALTCRLGAGNPLEDRRSAPVPPLFRARSGRGSRKVCSRCGLHHPEPVRCAQDARSP